MFVHQVNDLITNDLDQFQPSTGLENSVSSSSQTGNNETEPFSPSSLRDGEVMRIEIYAEEPGIHSQTYIREKIQIRKMIIQETAS